MIALHNHVNSLVHQPVRMLINQVALKLVRHQFLNDASVWPLYPTQLAVWTSKRIWGVFSLENSTCSCHYPLSLVKDCSVVSLKYSKYNEKYALNSELVNQNTGWLLLNKHYFKTFVNDSVQYTTRIHIREMQWSSLGNRIQEPRKKKVCVLLWLFLWMVIRTFWSLASSFSNYIPPSQTLFLSFLVQESICSNN